MGSEVLATSGAGVVLTSSVLAPVVLRVVPPANNIASFNINSCLQFLN
jgi:hypothetical protein